MARHAREEYSAKALGQSGATHRVIQPSASGGSDQSFDSTARRADPAFGITQAEANPTTASNEEFVEE